MNVRDYTVRIYGLSDPRDPERRIRYVGMTSKPIKDRRNEHYWNCASRKGEVRKWLRELKSLGMKPRTELLERCTYSNAGEAEGRWTEHHAATIYCSEDPRPPKEELPKEVRKRYEWREFMGQRIKERRQ